MDENLKVEIRKREKHSYLGSRTFGPVFSLHVSVKNKGILCFPYLYEFLFFLWKIKDI